MGRHWALQPSARLLCPAMPAQSTASTEAEQCLPELPPSLLTGLTHPNHPAPRCMVTDITCTLQTLKLKPSGRWGSELTPNAHPAASSGLQRRLPSAREVLQEPCEPGGQRSFAESTTPTKRLCWLRHTLSTLPKPGSHGACFRVEETPKHASRCKQPTTNCLAPKFTSFFS